MEGSLKALEMALQNEHSRPASLIHHSDRGSQYGSFAYIQRLRQVGIDISMTQHGDPYENAVAERVSGILKTNFLYGPGGWGSRSSVGSRLKTAGFLRHSAQINSYGVRPFNRFSRLA